MSANLEIGDHIYIERTGYVHHGIYVGNGEVIHYGGSIGLFNKECVIQSTLEEFSDGLAIYVKYYEYRRYGRLVSCARAYGRLNEDKYNILTNNCEHLVTWCITGKADSKQVNEKVDMLTSSPP